MSKHAGVKKTGNIIFEGKFKRSLAERTQALKDVNWKRALKADADTQYIVIGALTPPEMLHAQAQDSWHYKRAYRKAEDDFFCQYPLIKISLGKT
jgi:hypothetical protein